MSLDRRRPKDYRRAWNGEDAAKAVQPDWTITVCDSCLRASCWHGYLYCENHKSAGTVEITVAEARRRNQENPTHWLKDENVKQRLGVSA